MKVVFYTEVKKISRISTIDRSLTLNLRVRAISSDAAWRM